MTLTYKDRIEFMTDSMGLNALRTGNMDGKEDMNQKGQLTT